MPFLLEPMVAGELGEKTELDPASRPPAITRVQYVLDTPETDDLIESFPVFLVSEEHARRMVASGVSGVILADAEVVPSAEYEKVYTGRPHKRYRWLQVHGDGSSDCWLAADSRLCVSDRMMEIIEQTSIVNCDVERLLS